MRTTTESTEDTEQERDPLTAKVIVLVERKLILELNEAVRNNDHEEHEEREDWNCSNLPSNPSCSSCPSWWFTWP